MLHFFKILSITTLAIFLLSAGHPKTSSVKLISHKGKVVPFVIKRAKLEWVNGKLNLSMLSTGNKLVQLNNIKQEWLIDTTFRNNSVSYLLIDSNRTFIQHSRILPLIEIECKSPTQGKPVFIRAHGRVYLNRIWYTVTMEFHGNLPQKTFTTTH